MKLPVLQTRRVQAAGGAVVLVGVLAAAAPWLERLRPTSPDSFLTERFRVTNAGDAGPGTLREGIFAADRAGRAARVELDVSRIILETPLPPLLNPGGIVIDASRSHTQIVTRYAGTDSVFDVSAPQSGIVGVRIAGAAGPAVLARSNGLKIRDVVVEDSAVGVYLVDGPGQLSVSNSSFRRNGVAIHLAGNNRQIAVQNNAFEGNHDAAVWAVSRAPQPAGAPVQLELLHNQSSNDAQPFVVINVSARIEDNVVRDARTSGIYLSGSRVVVRRNRMRAGRSFGIEVVGLISGLIADNELDHNCAGGALVRDSRNTQIVANRIYANGSGIVVVSGDPGNPNRVTDNLVAGNQLDGLHVIGASPLVERNQLLQNLRAGLRISALSPDGRRVLVSKPKLAFNVVSGNGTNELSDRYAAGSVAAATPPTDCVWRLGNSATQVASRVVK